MKDEEGTGKHVALSFQRRVFLRAWDQRPVDVLCWTSCPTSSKRSQPRMLSCGSRLRGSEVSVPSHLAPALKFIRIFGLRGLQSPRCRGCSQISRSVSRPWTRTKRFEHRSHFKDQITDRRASEHDRLPRHAFCLPQCGEDPRFFAMRHETGSPCDPRCSGFPPTE
jgi:hypothetical protein